jgi:chromosome segregation ATPase
MNNDELLIAMKEMFDKKIEEVKTHTGVLVEHLGNELKAVAEGHEILLRKIDDTKTELNQSINNVERRMENVEKRIENVEKRIESVDKNMAIVKDYVIGVDLKLNEHEVILKRAK